MFKFKTKRLLLCQKWPKIYNTTIYYILTKKTQGNYTFKYVPYIYKTCRVQKNLYNILSMQTYKYLVKLLYTKLWQLNNANIYISTLTFNWSLWATILKLFLNHRKNLNLLQLLYISEYQMISTLFSILYKYKLPIVNNLKNLLYRLNPNRQRYILNLFIYFLKILYQQLIKIWHIAGYQIIIKGKIGRAGSVRKRKLYMKIGQTSLTTSLYSLSKHHEYIYTPAGVLGLTYTTIYKAIYDTNEFITTKLQEIKFI